MKWSPEQIKVVRAELARAPSKMEGYRRAALATDTTETAVRCLMQRIEASKGRPEPSENDSTLRSALAKYSDALSLRAEASKIKTLERDLDALRQAMDILAAATERPLPPIKRRELKSGMREATAVAMLSDVHSEEHVRLGETPVPNEYNPAIAERSIARFFAGYRWLIDFHRSAFQIRDVVLWLGGDLMSGHIHEELKEHTATPPIETLLWLRPRLAAGIDSLLADPKIERISIPCSYGNHGRNTAKPFRALGATHSYEWLLYQWLASIYEGNPRVQFLADRSAHQYMRVYEWDLHFHHGDETNYQGGVGGVTIPLSKSVAQWDKAKRCHYHHFGHWHQYIDVGRMTVNGSVIGYNAYAMSIKAEPEPPQQAFYILDSKRGKTCKCPIWVRE
ncbi:MAG: hypothetical protein KF795_00145 [Labilithrix sp.]|nr:hypothetical protein [Labilithrix sp.]